MKRIVPLLSGLLFALGLAVSGMTDPSKVRGFLDLAGHWDPSLAFVMVGAIGLDVVLFRVILRRGRPVFDTRFHLPTDTRVDAKLLGGAALFGVGWGLSGYCPGPALVSLFGRTSGALVFGAAMLASMTLYRWLARHGASGRASWAQPLDAKRA